MTPNRYAIYFLPGMSEEWARFCTSWLGWDVETGQFVPHPVIEGVADPISAITTVPRRYGLHATLKPPFRLRAGKSPAALSRVAQEMVTALSPVAVDGFRLTRLGRFLALTAEGDTTALNTTAAQIVRGLDGFRAPASDQELERRRAANLSPAQEANLQQWGYPYVMDQFRFHITLTGKLPKDDLARTEAALCTHLKPILPSPFVLKGIALVGEDDDGFFHLLERFAFRAD